MQYEKIISAGELKEAIHLLEIKHEDEWELLKEQSRVTYESLKPANLIKHTLHELAIAPDFKEDILNGALSLAAGYISNKIVAGTTRNPLKKLCGVLLQIGVTRIISKNMPEIKCSVTNMINYVFKKNADT